MIDDAECDICGSAHSPAVNPIIFCDGLGCDVPVHQKCYYVETIPEGPWYCKRCADKVPIYATNVVCCEQKSGALLRTSGKREYIHAVCAYWHPKISQNSDIIKVDPRLFAKKGCTICGIPTGLTVECSKPGCYREFHVTCALDTKILERTLRDFCNTYKLKCPKHFAVLAKENIREETTVYQEKSFHQSPHESSHFRNSSTTKLQHTPVEEVRIAEMSVDRSTKRNSFDNVDRMELKMFKAEQGGTFEWLAQKINAIKKAADDIGNLSPEFKAEIDKLKLPSLTDIPIKRYSQDNSNDKDKDYQDLLKKYFTAQEEINNLRKEVGRFKDAHQMEIKKGDSLKQSLFRLLKFFDLPDYIKLHAPSDIENALAMICKELD